MTRRLMIPDHDAEAVNLRLTRDKRRVGEDTSSDESLSSGTIGVHCLKRYEGRARHRQPKAVS